MQLVYFFSTPLWRHPGGWYFLSLPAILSAEIRQHSGWREQGWGRMPVLAKIGLVEWKTAIWLDSKSECYLLPVKAAIRQQTGVLIGQAVETYIRL